MTEDKVMFVRSIAEILADIDIMDLGDGNPDIVDEYLPEAEELAQRLQGKYGSNWSITPPELADMLCDVFEHWFETKFEAAEFEATSCRIVDLLNPTLHEQE